MRLLFLIILKGCFAVTIKPVSLWSWKVYASEYETAFLPPGHMWGGHSGWVSVPFRSVLGQGLTGQALGTAWRTGSEARLWGARGRWAGLIPFIPVSIISSEFLNQQGRSIFF